MLVGQPVLYILRFEAFMYFKDLSPYTYKLSTPIKSISNIGWLDSSGNFSTGKVSDNFLSKLESIIVGNTIFDASFNRIRGLHSCNICSEIGLEVYSGGCSEVLGMSEILIPDVSGNGYFASPSLIYHYISVHNYLPPKAYLNAVLSIDTERNFSAEDMFDKLLCNRND